MSESKVTIQINQISLLYVDDEEVLLTLGKRFLERSNDFKVDTVTSAKEVLHSGSLHRYDAIVSDYQMPEIDGIEFLKAVRNQGNDIPFILFTGRGREEVVIEAINNGADFYLQKGGDPKSQFAELSHKIKQAVGRKKAEKDLRNSRKQLADIIDFLPDATFAIDEAGAIIAWNKAIESMTGYSSSQMLGKGNYEYSIPFYGHRRPALIDLINASDEDISRYYSHISRYDDAIQAESEFINNKGKKITLFIKASPLYNSEGKVTGSIESIRDITELKSATHTICESEKKYRNLIEYSRDAILIVGFDGTIHFINSSGVKMVEEKSVDDVLARKNVMAYIHPDFREIINHEIEQVMLGNDRNICQFKIITRQNREIWVESDSRKIPFEGSEAIIVTNRDITKRKQAESDRDTFLHDVLSQQNFIKALLDAIPIPVLWKDTQLRYLGCNEAYSNFLGLKKEELEGKTIEEVWPDQTQALQITQHDQDLLIHKNLEPFQRKLTDRSGKTHDVIVSKNLFYDHAGNIAGIVGSIQDITDYKSVLQDMKSREELFRMIVTQSSDIFVIISPQNEVTYISPNHSHLTGFLTEEVIGPAGRFVHHDDFPVVKDRLDRLMNNCSSIETAEFRTLKRDGSYVLLEAVGVNCIDNPAIQGILITARDITHRKRTEQELSLMTRLFQDISNTSPIFAALLDEDGSVVFANRSFSTQNGDPDSHKNGGKIHDLFTSDWEKECEAVLRHVTQKREPSVHECRIYLKEGEKILSAVFFPIFEDDRSYIGFIGLDITELKSLMCQLNESINQNEVLEKLVEERTAEITNLLEMKNLLITAIAHDLRTPLTPLIALLPLLEHEEDKEKRIEITRILQKNATRIASIIQTLLHFNDLGSPYRVEDESEINLNELIGNLLQVHSITASKKDISIQTDLPDPIYIRSSLPHVISIFDNVLTNALKYSYAGGTIRICTKDLGEMIGVHIQDQGVGLTKTELSRVFEPFFKADPSRHDRSSSGLGLSVTKRLVLAIGGEIFIRSEGPGKGTDVEIRLKK